MSFQFSHTSNSGIICDLCPEGEGMDLKCHLVLFRTAVMRVHPAGYSNCIPVSSFSSQLGQRCKNPRTGAYWSPRVQPARTRKVKSWNAIWLAHYVYLYQYGLPKPSNVSNGPRTAPVRPGRHRGARSVRRESDANRIMFIYTISLGAARFTFLRENERVNSNYNLGINLTL